MPSGGGAGPGSLLPRMPSFSRNLEVPSGTAPGAYSRGGDQQPQPLNAPPALRGPGGVLLPPSGPLPQPGTLSMPPPGPVRKPSANPATRAPVGMMPSGGPGPGPLLDAPRRVSNYGLPGAGGAPQDLAVGNMTLGAGVLDRLRPPGMPLDPPPPPGVTRYANNHPADGGAGGAGAGRSQGERPAAGLNKMGSANERNRGMNDNGRLAGMPSPVSGGRLPLLGGQRQENNTNLGPPKLAPVANSNRRY